MSIKGKTSSKAGSKTGAGNFFEDFKVGQEIKHATPRTLTEADAALNVGLYGSRFAINSADVFAQSLGLPRAPLDDLLVFHVVIGKTVPDISLNAVANLGYAEFRWGVPVYPGDTLSAHSTVVGLRENSNRASGVVWVRSTGLNQKGEMVLDYVRWVMVHKRDLEASVGPPVVPKTAASVAPADLIVPAGLTVAAYDDVAAGSSDRWEDYAPGERIDHVSGITLEDSDHMFSTRLYQNTARVHFDAFAGKNTRFGRRLAYGGHIISLARALSFNGLANGFRMAAINAGSHVGPTFGGDTIYAWSEVLDKAPLPPRDDVGALRVRTIAAKDCPCDSWPGKEADGKYHPAVVLDLDYWLLIPRR
jgi:2-methylfumaryl-CoA hydratase